MVTTPSLSPLYNTTVNVISTNTSGATTIQADCSYGYEPWVVGVAAGIPSFLVLVLVVILVLVCVHRGTNCSWKQTSQSRNVQEHEYASSPPRPSEAFYMTITEGTTNIYVNEDQEKDRKTDIQTQAKLTRMNKPRREAAAEEYFYENRLPYNWKKSTK